MYVEHDYSANTLLVSEHTVFIRLLGSNGRNFGRALNSFLDHTMRLLW